MAATTRPETLRAGARPPAKLIGEGLSNDFYADENSAAYEDVVKLDDSEMFVSALIFGLRMRSGIDFSELCGRFPAARHLEKLNILKDMQSYGLVDISGERIRLTRAGILVADAVAVELI